jgi:hypothetical protein
MPVGPDAGGGGWQYQMYGRIVYHAAEHGLDTFVVVIPRRVTRSDVMWQFRFNDSVTGFEYQLDWEREYIRLAALDARRGCVAAWLPRESTTDPRTDGQPYARDTRGELGEIRGWMSFVPSTRFVMGAEDGFPGLDVIRRNFNAVVSGVFPIYESIDDLARGAVRVAKRAR